MENCLQLSNACKTRDTLLPLFIIYINDFESIISSRYSGIIVQLDTKLSSDLPDLGLCFKNADDTGFLGETEADLQKARDATTNYCNDNNMAINIPKQVFFSLGKVRKTSYMPCMYV